MLSCQRWACRGLQAPGVLPSLRGLSTLHDDIYDVVIVGGGLVGTAMAAALSANKWTEQLQVAVLDRQVPPSVSSALDEFPGLRVSTVTPGSVAFLQRCLDWQDVAPPRSAAFSTMQVWDRGGNGMVRYNASEAGQEQIGYVAENLVLHTAFLRRLTRPGSTPVFQPPAVLESISLPPYEVSKAAGGSPLAQLRLEGGRLLKAKLVVGADGGRSQVRELSGLRTVSRPYNQRGVVATVRTDVPNTTAHQRFLDTGPLALLPVRGGFSNVVWSTTPPHAASLSACSPLQFADKVNEALNGGPPPRTMFGSSASFEGPARVLEYVGTSPKSFPLVLTHAGRYVRPRLALVGDAAHSVHPLAGQGVNLGFGDVEALADALAHAVECGRDLGELTLLQEMYEAPRQAANVGMMAALDGLQKVFQPQQGWLAQARGAGLGIINSSSLAKQQIMKYAMGL